MGNTGFFLFLHCARNVESLENGEIILQVNSVTDNDSQISKIIFLILK
jgi:hypothetical protein